MYEQEREGLVASLIRKGDIRSQNVIEAMRNVKRELFVPIEIRHLAYKDSPQTIGHNQTISAPHMVGIMAERLDLKNGQKVLEIGAGSGYHAAVIANIVGAEGHVYTVERIPALAAFARENINAAALSSHITVFDGDGSKGLPEHAPYDRIFVACAAPDIPQPLVEQLADGGKLLIPVGGRWLQKLFQIEKKDDGTTTIREFEGCVFVPLVGEHGFRN
jgi:protein-L-isoaspartate(D-aspartate) O-methyltransferase